MEALEQAHPGLLDGLVQHDGIGFAVIRSEAHGIVALGRNGVHYLDEGWVEGLDPLLPFGPAAAGEVRRHGRLAHVGDIVLNSRVDEATGEVAAFEELVGCHGGLGGWQSDAVLIYPSEWSLPAPLVGADAVHRQLVDWLVALGQRKGLDAPARTTASVGGR